MGLVWDELDVSGMDDTGYIPGQNQKSCGELGVGWVGWYTLGVGWVGDTGYIL